ncbi:MAG: LLM class F420-dependent oxidoreductase [Cumulibacter sp.]
MTQQNRFGVTIPLGGLSLPEHAAAYAAAAEAGYTDLWSSESNGADAFIPLAHAATLQPQLHVGTAIVPAYTRAPGVVAMQAATLAELTDQPLQLGIGSSSMPIVSNWNGIPFDRPLTRVKDLLEFLRRSFDGERVSMKSHSFDIDGFRLGLMPKRRPRVLVAALREKMLRLAGTHSDGVILNWLSAEDIQQVTRYVNDGRDTPADVVARIFVIPTADRTEAENMARRAITAYLNVPTYADYQAWLGRGPKLQSMWDAWRSGDRKRALAEVSSEVVDELFIHGTAEECRAHIQRYVDAGVTVPVLSIYPTTRPIADVLRELGPRATS